MLSNYWQGGGLDIMIILNGENFIPNKNLFFERFIKVFIANHLII